jgi:hypothetical protein
MERAHCAATRQLDFAELERFETISKERARRFRRISAERPARFAHQPPAEALALLGKRAIKEGAGEGPAPSNNHRQITRR